MNESPATPGGRLAALAQLALTQLATVARLEDELSAASTAAQRTLRTDLPELMKELGVSEVALGEQGVKIALTQGVDISIPEAHRPNAYAWMVEHGYGALVRAEVKVVFGATELERANACAEQLAAAEYETQVNMSVPAPTLKAWARERLSAGEDIPPALFNVRAYDMARISNLKRK
jgi:hypothetical protein